MLNHGSLGVGAGATASAAGSLRGVLIGTVVVSALVVVISMCCLSDCLKVAFAKCRLGFVVAMVVYAVLARMTHVYVASFGDSITSWRSGALSHYNQRIVLTTSSQFVTASSLSGLIASCAALHGVIFLTAVWDMCRERFCPRVSGNEVAAADNGVVVTGIASRLAENRRPASEDEDPQPDDWTKQPVTAYG